jgi:transposase
MRKRTREIDPELLEALEKKAGHGVVNIEAYRARGVLAFFQGSTYAEIHERFGWATHTTARWVGRVRVEGIAGLARKPRATPPPRVRGLLEVWLPEVVRKSPRLFGREQDRWTLESLRILCEEQTGERVCLESIRLALHRFGESWKRAKRTITSPDPEYEAKRGQCSSSSRTRRRTPA